MVPCLSHSNNEGALNISRMQTGWQLTSHFSEVNAQWKTGNYLSACFTSVVVLYLIAWDCTFCHYSQIQNVCAPIWDMRYLGLMRL